MKFLSSLLVLFTLSILLMACPYKSNVGIDDGPTVKIDKELIGTWHKATYPSDSTELIFVKATPQQYALNAKASDGEGGYTTHRYMAWFSMVSKWKLITLFDTESKEYSFGETAMINKQLDLKVLSEDITTQKFTTTTDMKKFVEDLYSSNKVIYDNDIDLNDLIKEK